MLTSDDPALYGVSVLLVDRDSSHRTIARLQLQAFGADVREASTPSEALTSLEEDGPGVMVTELHFGGREVIGGQLLPRRAEGLALVEHTVQKLSVPVVVLTTLALPPERAAAAAAGCHAFVPKPYAGQELRRAVARAAASRGAPAAVG